MAKFKGEDPGIIDAEFREVLSVKTREVFKAELDKVVDDLNNYIQKCGNEDQKQWAQGIVAYLNNIWISVAHVEKDRELEEILKAHYVGDQSFVKFLNQVRSSVTPVGKKFSRFDPFEEYLSPSDGREIKIEGLWEVKRSILASLTKLFMGIGVIGGVAYGISPHIPHFSFLSHENTATQSVTIPLPPSSPEVVAPLPQQLPAQLSQEVKKVPDEAAMQQAQEVEKRKFVEDMKKATKVQFTILPTEIHYAGGSSVDNAATVIQKLFSGNPVIALDALYVLRNEEGGYDRVWDKNQLNPNTTYYVFIAGQGDRPKKYVVPLVRGQVQFQ